MVWLKIRKHDIILNELWCALFVVVWLKIRKHDIYAKENKPLIDVVVWLKIRKHDIKDIYSREQQRGCGLIKD